MKHEYTADELAELKSIYDESGEAGLQIGEMRALRKAGLLTQGMPAKPAEPSKRDLILAHCKNRIDQGQPFDGKETAEALGMSQKTVGNILSQLRKEGLLPAFDKHSPRKTTRKNTTTGKKKETIMTTTSKPAASKEEPMSQGNHRQQGDGTGETVREHARHHHERAGRHLRLHLGIAACRIPRQRQGRIHVRHQAAGRRTHGPESQLQQGRKMKLNFDSKDGVFTVKSENEEEKAQLKTSAVAICNLIIDFFDGEVQEMKAAKE